MRKQCIHNSGGRLLSITSMGTARTTTTTTTKTTQKDSDNNIDYEHSYNLYTQLENNSFQKQFV